MIAGAEKAPCPIWGTEAEVVQAREGKLVGSQRAGGEYRLSEEAEEQLATYTPEQKALLTSWLVEQRLGGERRPLVDTAVLTALETRGRLLYSNRKRRLFLWLSRARWRPDDILYVGGEVTELVTMTVQQIGAWIESTTEVETSQFLRLMIEEGFLAEAEVGRLRLTPKGFEQLESVEATAGSSDQAFVAMWFDDQMTDAYENGIVPAIKDCGFLPFRVEQKETINKIDDEIIAEIRRSHFVVADFTCGSFECDGNRYSVPRGGVYFEAGFAQGLGRPVIWTVREDCIGDVHFDTRQFAHIVWSDAADLRKKLTNRIRAVIPVART